MLVPCRAAFEGTRAKKTGSESCGVLHFALLKQPHDAIVIKIMDQHELFWNFYCSSHMFAAVSRAQWLILRLFGSGSWCTCSRDIVVLKGI